jgi:hypothetical protein
MKNGFISLVLSAIRFLLTGLGALCFLIAYSLGVVALDKLFPSLGNLLWLSATVPIIAAGFWFVFSEEK